MRLCLFIFASLILAACASPSGPVASRSVSAPVSTFHPPAALHVCPGMRIGFAPRYDGQGRILTYRPTVAVNGVSLLVSPVRDVCLSRSEGRDRADAHEGLDLAPLPRDRARMVRAGGAGIVREVNHRHDFGVHVVIDHGRGVFTRYAHLAFTNPGIAPGRRVAMGEPIGQMGGTGGVPVHLHYAILRGDYDTPAASFGLTPVDPFDIAAR